MSAGVTELLIFNLPVFKCQYSHVHTHHAYAFKTNHNDLVIADWMSPWSRTVNSAFRLSGSSKCLHTITLKTDELVAEGCGSRRFLKALVYYRYVPGCSCIRYKPHYSVLILQFSSQGSCFYVPGVCRGFYIRHFGL